MDLKISKNQSELSHLSKKNNSSIYLRNDKIRLTKLTQSGLLKWEPITEKPLIDIAPFQLIDFFCGCGGMTLGFQAISKIMPAFELLGGSDIDQDALTSYQRNFGVPAIKQDIRDLAENEDELAYFLQKIRPRDVKKPLVVIGCAPCQGFTAYRKKKWSEEDHRNSLVEVFTSVAIRLNADCIVMENVPEVLSDKYWSYFEKAQTMLNKAGYVVKQNIFNTAEFGVPQERFRALIIAMKKDFKLPDSMLKAEQFMTVRDAIGNLPPVNAGKSHPNDPFHRSANHRIETIDTIKSIPKNGGSRPYGVGPKCLDKIKGFSDVYGRLSWDKPAITITHYARNPASGRFVHPEQNRGLTMREASLLQSFPRNFKFLGTFDSIFKQIGEAVPPMFSCAVAASVFVELSSNPPTSEELRHETIISTPVSNSFASVIAGMKIARTTNE